MLRAIFAGSCADTMPQPDTCIVLCDNPGPVKAWAPYASIPRVSDTILNSRDCRTALHTCQNAGLNIGGVIRRLGYLVQLISLCALRVR